MFSLNISNILIIKLYEIIKQKKVVKIVDYSFHFLALEKIIGICQFKTNINALKWHMRQEGKITHAIRNFGKLYIKKKKEKKEKRKEKKNSI